MLVFLPVSLEEAFDAFEQCPDAQLLAGGTDFMVEVNFALRRPPAVVCLRKVAELGGGGARAPRSCSALASPTPSSWPDARRPSARPRAGVAHSRLPADPQRRHARGQPRHRLRLPATSSRCSRRSTPGSSWLQRRGAGASGSPISSSARSAPRSARARSSPRSGSRPLSGSQEFLKVGTRNAMVIAVAERRPRRRLGRPIGAVRARLGRARGDPGPRSRGSSSPPGSTGWGRTLAARRRPRRVHGALVRSAARPIDDHRSTADYRRHAVGVCAERALARAFANHNGERSERTPWAS